MPTVYNMEEGDELYRAILEHDVQPTREEPNPHYNPNYVNRDPITMPWRRTIRVPDGPVKAQLMVIGPYTSTAPIKAFITRNRGKGYYKNLRIKRIERVSVWEEVEQ